MVLWNASHSSSVEQDYPFIQYYEKSTATDMQGRNLGISPQNAKGKFITVYNTYNHTKISQEPAGTHVGRHLILKHCTATHYHTKILRFCRGNSREQGERRRVYEQWMESILLSASRWSTLKKQIVWADKDTMKEKEHQKHKRRSNKRS